MWEEIVKVLNSGEEVLPLGARDVEEVLLNGDKSSFEGELESGEEGEALDNQWS